MTRFGTGAAERLKQSEHEFEKKMVVSSKNGELLSLRTDGHDDSFSLHMNTRGDANDLGGADVAIRSPHFTLRSDYARICVRRCCVAQACQ